MKSAFHTFQEKIRILRSQGKTYSEIKKRLKINVPKSTLSYWCKKVTLPDDYHRKVARLNNQNLNVAQKMAWLANKKKQENLLKDLWNKNKYLINKTRDKDVLKMILSFLYITEGSKWRSHRGLLLANSDPTIIQLYMKLLERCYSIPKSSFKARICYRADQDLNLLKRYWSKITGIPIRNFYNSQPDPRTKGKITHKKDYKGVCSLSCRGTKIQLELEIIPKLLLSGL